MKKINILLSITMIVCLLTGNVIAEDYSDSAYWEGLCNAKPLSEKDKKACDGYWAYLIKNSMEKADQIASDIKKLEGDLKAAQELVNKYTKNIENLQAQIDKKVEAINKLQADIDALQIKIDDNNKKIDELNQKVLERMKSKQAVMHFNSFIDFILGSSSFEQMLRRSYGLSAIMTSDNKLKDEIQNTLKVLSEDKETLKTSKEDLETQKKVLDSQKIEFDAMRKAQYEIMAKTDAQLDELREAKDKEGAFIKDLEEKRKELGSISSSNGFIKPLSNYYISAGFPYYPASFGGGLHLGVDYAAPMGTNIVAPANGIIFFSVNGCDSYGHLGSNCGYQQGGSAGGGNQFSIVMSVNGKVYAMSAFHLKKDSLAVKAGDIVLQGEYIGQVGTSGNSTGPHAHVEFYYLGKGEPSDIPDIIANNRSLSYGCGWGYNAVKRICTNNGYSAPCRLDAREYF